MRPLTEDDLRASLVNATAEERELMAVPFRFLFVDWDHVDFYAWRDPQTRGRGYLVTEHLGEPTGVLLRAAEGTPRAHASLCNICHTMQPANQVTLFTARRANAKANSVGTYMCADLSCHENVRLAVPLAPNEVRGSVDRKIDGARARSEAFVDKVLDGD